MYNTCHGGPGLTQQDPCVVGTLEQAGAANPWDNQGILLPAPLDIDSLMQPLCSKMHSISELVPGGVLMAVLIGL